MQNHQKQQSDDFPLFFGLFVFLSDVGMTLLFMSDLI